MFSFDFNFLYRHERKPGLKEANKGLDWLVSFIDMYFLCYALVVKYCPLFKCCLFYSVHENVLAKNSNIHY